MITAGTLLGAVRERGHIPHETDIDIQIRKEDSSFVGHLIYNALNETHFVFIPGFPSRLFFSQTNEIHVDIWLYTREANNYTQEVMPRKGKGYQHYLVDDDIIFPLSQCEYDGYRYPCARQGERYLALRYGKDWRMPKPKYTPNPKYHDGDDSEFLLGKRVGKLTKFSCPAPNITDPMVSQELMDTFFQIIQIFKEIQCPYFLTVEREM